MNEVLVLVMAVALAAALVALGSPFVADAGRAAWKLSEYRALYVTPTIHVVDGEAWLCFNKTVPAAAYNATDGRPLRIDRDCYKGPGRSCTPHKTRNHDVYCKAWVGPLRPGDAVTYIMRGNVAERAITIQINSISAQ